LSQFIYNAPDQEIFLFILCRLIFFSNSVLLSINGEPIGISLRHY